MVATNVAGAAGRKIGAAGKPIAIVNMIVVSTKAAASTKIAGAVGSAGKAALRVRAATTMGHVGAARQVKAGEAMASAISPTAIRHTVSRSATSATCTVKSTRGTIARTIVVRWSALARSCARAFAGWA